MFCRDSLDSFGMGDESFLLGVSVSDILVLLLLNGRMVEISWQEMKMEGQYLFESNQLCSNWSTVMGREGKESGWI